MKNAKGGIKKVNKTINTPSGPIKIGGVTKTNKVMNTQKYKKGGKVKSKMKGC